MKGTTMNEITMVRYGRVDGQPKNCLFTIRRDNIIYFGISRCRFDSGDRFVKDKGRFIASERAALVIDELDDGVNDLTVDTSGLRGAVNRDNVVKLLQYFDNVDAIIKQKKIAARKSRNI
jgi:hypothetical protein